jgi:acyl transferase domain-containing protein
MDMDPKQIDRRVLLQNALTAVDRLQTKLDAVERAKSEPIAIIGMSCRFPGGANNPEAYWELLCAGTDAVREVPAERWNVADYVDPDSETEVTWYGGFLDQIDQFDPQFFGIAPREAESMDPQQRLVLEVSWEALERAGQAPDKLKGSQTGIFIGITTNDYSQMAKLGGPAQLDVYSATGTALNVAPGRVAYTLGFQGPSVAIDTACSSSLVAVHLACQSLRSGESDMALAGGVNALLAPEAFVCFSKWGMMAPNGRCKTFDSGADGFVRGEGCGVIVLKRLSDALAAGDNILAVIRGSAVNQDGRSSGLTVPNGLAQQVVVRKALANARVKPAEVGYVEAHGTGTSLGDPIEIEALGAALGEGRSNDKPLIVASVKTNIGHLESASGIAGLMKVVLSMQHRELPPHLHLHERSPRIPWPNFPVTIPTERTPWASPHGARIAGVSSFGFSGTNAHVILEEAPAPQPSPREAGIEGGDSERPCHLLTLSAKTETALKQLAAQFGSYLAEQPVVAPADVAYTANQGRAQFNHRLAIAAESTEQMRERLAAWVTGQQPAGLSYGQTSATQRPRIAFLFTGQGAQYVQMGRRLYETQPLFRQILDQCNELLAPYLGQSLLSVLYPPEGTTSPLDQTAYTQPALFALEYALARLWISWGVVPAVVMGHSVGEYVAACIAGVFSLEDGLKLIAERGRLMQALPPGGEMAAVFADEAQVAEAVRPYADQVSIAAVNGPQNIVISGAGSAVQAILRNLEAEGLKAQKLTVSHAFHSPLMEPMLDSFGAVAASIKYNSPQLNLVSNVTGRLAGQEVTQANYWRQHVRASVQFAAGLQTLHEQGYQLFLEIGPKPTLLSMGQRCLPAGTGVWLPSLRSGRDDWQQMLESLGNLYVNGLDVDWANFEQGYVRHKLSLPTYPFQRQRYWLESKAETTIKRPTARTGEAGQHPLLGARLDLAHVPGTYLWQGELDLKRLPYLDDHRVQDIAVVPATAYIEMAMAATVEVLGEGSITVTETQNKKVLTLSEAVPPPLVQVMLYLDEKGLITFQIFSRRQRLEQPARPNEPWTLHVTGKLRHTPADSTDVAVQPFDPEAIKARCVEEISGEAFYQKLAEKGNQWGPCFQGIECLWRGEGEALSLVRVPPVLESEFDRYQFHPAVSDACGHVLTATISMDKSENSKGGAFVGGGVDEGRLYQHPQGPYLWAYARLRPQEDGAENILIGDVQVMDETGALISETIGAHLWYLDRDEQQTLLQNLEDWFYELQWQPVDRQAAVSNDRTNWLVFADQSGVGEALSASLKTEGDPYVLVTPGHRYEQVAERHFTIRPEEPEDLHHLLQDITTSEQNGAYQIVHLWSLDAASPEMTTISSLERAQTLGCTTILYLIQALTQAAWPISPRLWLVTQGAQAVDPKLPVAFAQAPLWGLGRTLITEFSEFWGGLIDLDPNMAANDAAAHLIREIQAPDGEDQLAFRQGQRYAARLVRPSQLSASAHPIQLRAEGSYLVTGGVGGLGLEVARWLVQHGARHLILMGRTRLPARVDWDQIDPESALGRRIAALQKLEALGATLYLPSVDVADETQLRSFLEQFAQEGLPSIRGVVHAAGIMQYQSLLEHNASNMEAILRPKVKGGWLLHHLLKDAPLDFYVLFSSASALLSSPLIGSYAAANTFLDALAHHRRAMGTPALSINWGLWSEVGMGADFDKGQRAESSPGGMGLIAPERGLEALARLLTQSSAQVGVMPVNWPQWQRIYPAFSRSRLLSHLIEPVETNGSASSRVRLTPVSLMTAQPEERPALLESYLSHQVADILRLPLTSLESDESLANLGFDSLMALELKNRIEADLTVVVPMVQFLQGPSVIQLAELLLDKVSKVEATPIEGDNAQESQPPQEDVTQLLASLDQLSEDQVDLLLNNLLAESKDN